MRSGFTAYRNFLVRLLVGILLLFAVDFFIGSLLRKLYFEQKAGEYYKANYVIDSTKADVLILGSSRASHHYISALLKDSIGVDCYNAGRDGTGLLYNFAVFKSILSRYTPKAIILDLSPMSLYYETDEYEKLSLLSPYYSSHKEVRDIVHLKSSLEKYKVRSGIYPFNSELISLFKGKFFSGTENNNEFKGYEPLSGRLKPVVAINTLPDTNGKLDSIKIKALDNIANVCTHKNIRLFFVYSPIFNNGVNNLANSEIVKIAERYKITYWDFSKDSTFDNHPEYFKNSNHLNHKGAQLFSQFIAKNLSAAL